MPVAVRKVSISSEPETSYFLRLDWQGPDLASGFQVLLTDGQTAWDGEVSGDAVCSEAVELEMEIQSYVQDLHQVLTGGGGGEGGGGAGHGFTLTPRLAPGNSRTLTYERRQKDIWIRLGSVSLRARAEPLQDVRALLAHLLSQTVALEGHNGRLREENGALQLELSYITTELERYAVAKEALEADLFSRFVLVLNEKKAKIRSLQERITHLQDHSREEGETSGSARRERVTAAAKPASGEEEEEEEYGGSTDEEEESGPGPALQPSDMRGRAGVSEGNDEDDDDGSLSDSLDVAPCRKRRFRHLRPPPELAMKRPTPEMTRTHRRDPPPKSNTAANQEPAPQRSSDAMTTGPDVEDLFEDL